MSSKTFSLVALWLAVSILTACGRGNGGHSQIESSNSQARNSLPTVTLSKSQLGVVKTAAAQLQQFRVETEVLGSVSFIDDPALIQAESNLVQAASTYAADQQELTRARVLVKTNGISEKELEQTTSELESAAAGLRAARDALRTLGESNVQIDQMIRLRQVEPSLSGRLTTKVVNANAVESESSLFHTGQQAQVSLMALPGRTFTGLVREVYSTIDPNSHRETLRILVSDPKNELRGGMLADIIVEVGRPEASVAVPEKAVVREGDGSTTAWVTTDGMNFVQRTVKTGLRENGSVQILEGLHQGELVVTDGAIFLDNMLNAPPSE